MKYKLAFDRNKSKWGNLGVDDNLKPTSCNTPLPSKQWMENNIGDELVDWKCYVETAKYDHDGNRYRSKKIVIEFKEEDKMVMFILRCG